MGSTNNTNSGGGTANSIDDDYNPNLVYTSDDVLAMANSGDNENNSQFFITNAVERPWDFRYTILGVMTAGGAFRQTLAAVPTTTNTSTNFLQPNDPVVIDSVSLIADKTDGVLELSAPTSAIGKSYTVYVTLSDGNPADSIEYPLVVNVVEDPTPPPPYLQTPNGSTSVHVVSGGSASLNLTAYVPPGDALAGYAAQFAYDSGTPSDGSCGFSAFNSTTGQTTITAAANFAGQTEVLVGVDVAERFHPRFGLRHHVCPGVRHAHRAGPRPLAAHFARLGQQRHGKHEHPVHFHRGVSRGDGEVVCRRTPGWQRHRQRPPRHLPDERHDHHERRHDVFQRAACVYGDARGLGDGRERPEPQRSVRSG